MQLYPTDKKATWQQTVHVCLLECVEEELKSEGCERKLGGSIGITVIKDFSSCSHETSPAATGASLSDGLSAGVQHFELV